MNAWALPLEFFMYGAMLAMMLLGLASAAVMPGMERWSRRYFITLFADLVLVMCFCLAESILSFYPNLRSAHMTVMFVESVFLSIPMPMLSVFLLHCCGENIKSSPLFHTSIALWTVFFILLSVSMFTTFLFYVEPDGEYVYGRWYPLLPAPLDAIMLLNLVAVIRRRKSFSGKTYLALLSCLLPLLVTMLVHTIIINYLLLAIGLTLFTLSMFGIILFDQIEQYLRQQREIAHQRSSIMVLQMRPHFIYNTMTSIYYLCDLDSKKAQQVTMDFTTYLRKNFTAIASDEPVPFTEELEHTRAYLAVEQAQFEESLSVDYDTPHTQFHIPPLTLQPIVENSIKHGMDPDSEPLRITIQTRDTVLGSEILVTDNGTGFGSADDNEPHIALENIRQRLRMMCGGTLEIGPRQGGGTVVRVFVPADKKSQEDHPSGMFRRARRNAQETTKRPRNT